MGACPAIKAKCKGVMPGFISRVLVKAWLTLLRVVAFTKRAEHSDSARTVASASVSPSHANWCRTVTAYVIILICHASPPTNGGN